MKPKAFLQKIGIKTSVIIGLLILFHLVSLIAQRHFYPVAAYNMFAQIHPEQDAILYVPYGITQAGELLIRDSFNSWPIRHADIHNTVEYWVKNDTASTLLPDLGPYLLDLLRRWHSNSNRHEHQLKCYGIMQLRWPVAVSPELREQSFQTAKMTEYCDEK